MKLNNSKAKCEAVASNIINNINIDMVKWQNSCKRKDGQLPPVRLSVPKIVAQDWSDCRDIADAIRREDLLFARFMLPRKDTEVRELLGQEAYDFLMAVEVPEYVANPAMVEFR
jgi:hypothetical protein